MNYYKTGCYWGSGNDDYYEELISKDKVVFCDDKIKPVIGDVIAISRGFSIIALARVRSDMISVTDSKYFYLKDKVDKYKIDYKKENMVVDITAPYKLSETIMYQNEKGISGIEEKETLKKIKACLPNADSEFLLKDTTNLLKENYNLILHGAPGTGKSYLAERIAKEGFKTGEDGYKMVQFHPSYDYTDFVEGLRPSANNSNGDIAFKRVDGEFKKFCKKALKNPEKPYVFHIDEINRGEISKIFGELFFSLEANYRGIKPVQTQYQNLVEENDEFAGGFYIPKNVYIIGTMNDIDRSVDNMDFAFRRRFAFREITAFDTQTSILKNLLTKNPAIYDEAIERMNKLNDTIYSKNEHIEGLSASYHVGGAYFEKLLTLNCDFNSLWELHLKGLLTEYVRGLEDSDILLRRMEDAYYLRNK